MIKYHRVSCVSCSQYPTVRSTFSTTTEGHMKKRTALGTIAPSSRISLALKTRPRLIPEHVEKHIYNSLTALSRLPFTAQPFPLGVSMLQDPPRCELFSQACH